MTCLVFRGVRSMAGASVDSDLAAEVGVTMSEDYRITYDVEILECLFKVAAASIFTDKY